ncbi:MAG: rhodanese-like domain-containing protein [Campylobacterales bacterium]
MTTTSWGLTDLSNDELEMLREGEALIIDVRTEKEWINDGVIKGAAMITYFDESMKPDKKGFMQQLEKLTKGDKNRQIVLVCRSGQRSKLVAGVLEREGYTNLYHLAEGMIGWKKEGRTVCSNQSNILNLLKSARTNQTPAVIAR